MTITCLLTIVGRVLVFPQHWHMLTIIYIAHEPAAINTKFMIRKSIAGHKNKVKW